MKNKILLAVMFFLLICVAVACFGIYKYINQKVTITESSGNLRFSGIEISLPDGWNFLETDENNIYIRTDYRPYDVDLVISYKKNNKSDIESYNSSYKNYNSTEIAEGKIYQIPCGGPLSCQGAIIGKDLYVFIFDIRSNQIPPENVEGVWSPGHNITSDLIQSIMLSIRSVK